MKYLKVLQHVSDHRGSIIREPPDDEHMCSKHVEAWNKLIVKQILCIKLVNYWDKYTEMHGQQNIKKWEHF